MVRSEKDTTTTRDCCVKIYQDFHALIIVEEKGAAGSVMRKV